ncbi:MAG: ABC transporter substrate-binding protein [Dictyoglomaceae bacterium]
MKKFLLVLLLSIIFFLVSSSFAENIIKIGVIAPLTGSQAIIGTNVVNGIKSAVKRINDSGGINGSIIKLIIYDDRNIPDEGVAAARRLIYEDKVKIIIGSIGSSVTLAIQQLTMRENIFLVTPVSMSPALTQRGDKYFFRVTATAEMRQRGFVSFVVENLKPKTIAYLAANDDLGRSEVEAAEKFYAELKGPVTIFKAFFDPSESNFISYLTKIKALNPDVLFIVADSVKASTIVKQAKTLGVKSTILSSAEAATAQFLQLAGDAAEGVYFPLDWSPEFTDKYSKEFLNAYKEDYGTIPDTKFAVQGWEAMWIVAEAIKRAGGIDNLAKLREAFLNLTWTGPRGTWKFKENGDPIGISTFVVVVKNGKFERVLTK